MAELEARAESESDRARNLEGELAAIQADAMAQLATAQEALSHAEEQRTKAMTRMAELEARAESESDRARNLEGELAAIQADAMAQRALTAERTLLLEERTAAALADAERQRDALRAANGHLREIEGDLHAAATQKAELAGRAAMAESTLAQRQEEIAQLFDRLVAAEARAAEARALLDEQHVGRSEDRAAIARLANELAESNVRLADLAREADARERRLQEVEEARTLAERGLAARFDEIANLTSLLMSETGRHGEVQENVKWLRSMAEVAAGFPAWWTILPRRWREDRAHARYLRAGLFDAQRYRELNPDVAADGMDPVRHYIFHGIAEGRARP
jgi:chromosome segregation ATPase